MKRDPVRRGGVGNLTLLSLESAFIRCTDCVDDVWLKSTERKIIAHTRSVQWGWVRRWGEHLSTLTADVMTGYALACAVEVGITTW